MRSNAFPLVRFPRKDYTRVPFRVYHDPEIYYQTNLEGQSRLFSVGCYQDKVRFESGRLRFCDKRVVVDTYSVPTLLATPL